MTAPERKDATALVDEWLLEPENYGLRIERLAGSFPSNMGELTPWLVAACDCGLSQHQAALDRIAELEGALRPFAFEEDATTQEAWELRYCDRFKDWIDFGDIDTARAVLAKGDG